MAKRSTIPAPAAGKFVLGFEGTSLLDALGALLAGGLAGVALFPRNFRSPAGLRELTTEIRRAAGRPVLIGVDQEGGTRFSLPEPFTQWPSAAELGGLDSPELAEETARGMARELRAVGCNLDFAPMLDLHVQPDSPVTTGRSFGADPQRVARLGEAFARGLAAEGVLACGKHFPGHGDTQVDPHEDLPVFRGTAERLRRMELAPFAGAVAAGVPLLMTAHILLPEIDAERPASLSKKILTGLLREEMGFGGAILADDLGMGAIRKRWTPAEAAVETFGAGSDLAMLCHDWALVTPALERVAAAAEAGEFNDEEWKRSSERIERLRERAAAAETNPPPLSVVGCAEHRALAREIRARAAKRLDHF
jgi:beta-N-acetylhexosaminidase